MVFILVKIFRVVVLVRFSYLKNEKFINVVLKSFLFKNIGDNDYFSSVVKVKYKVWYRMLF